MLVNYAVITYLNHKLTAVGTEKFPVLAQHFWFTSLAFMRGQWRDVYFRRWSLFHLGVYLTANPVIDVKPEVQRLFGIFPVT